jgi:hypothetical protein
MMSQPNTVYSDAAYEQHHNAGSRLLKKRAKRAFAQPDKEEARARRKAAKTLPGGFSVDEVTKIIQKNVFEYKTSRKASNRILYIVLSSIYDEFLFLDANPDEQDRFWADCLRENITIKAGTDLSVILIRFHLNPSKETRSRYALVLREAAFRRIRAGELATTLRKKGSSIKAMARAFTDRRKESSEKPAITERTIKLACSGKL